MTLRHMPSGPRQYKDELKNALVEPSTKCKGFKSLMACTISVVLNIILSYLSTNCFVSCYAKTPKIKALVETVQFFYFSSEFLLVSFLRPMCSVQPQIYVLTVAASWRTGLLLYISGIFVALRRYC